MAGSDVLHLPLPDQVYRDALMEYAVLGALRELHVEQTGHQLPPALSMALYNDILAYARTVLEESNFAKLVAYADSLWQQVPGVRGSDFPPPLEDEPEQGSQANSLAEQLLGEGIGSLWSASRQVIAQLPFRTEKRLSDTVVLRTVRLGAYGHHSFFGMTNLTAVNRSVCVLLNGLVRLFRPEHVWTTLVITLNSQVPVHMDSQNARLPTLLIGVSHYQDGQIWIQSQDGTTFEEHKNAMVPGTLHQTSMRCLLFQASTQLHGVKPWQAGDRFVLAAYTIGQFRHLQEHDLTALKQLGFQLPRMSV